MTTPTLPYYTREAVLDACSRDHAEQPCHVIRVEPGHGRHVHDSTCPRGPLPPTPDNPRGCLKHCDDSDLIVEIEYGDRGYRAVYGVLDGRPILWMD